VQPWPWPCRPEEDESDRHLSGVEDAASEGVGPSEAPVAMEVGSSSSECAAPMAQARAQADDSSESDSDSDIGEPVFPQDFDQEIILALAFNRGAATDRARLKQMATETGAYVISCSHNPVSSRCKSVENPRPEHINTTFGSTRFLETLAIHFETVLWRRVRVDTIVLDWHWLQTGYVQRSGVKESCFVC
jgi:hypothetical protein